MTRRGEYTPIQISFDLGSPIHREALFQVLLTMEQEEPEPAYDERVCCGGDACESIVVEDEEADVAVDLQSGDILDPNG